MSPQEQAVGAAADRVFESLAEDLDRISNAWELDSVAMMAIVHKWADFAGYYAEWIQQSWEEFVPVDEDA